MTIRDLVSAGLIAVLLYGGPSLADPSALHGELCAACHGTRGAPLDPNLYPSLYDNPRIAAAGALLVANKILRGAGNMYPFCRLVSDAEVAALANDLAQANGHPGPPLNAATVAALRPAAEDCPDPLL